MSDRIDTWKKGRSTEKELHSASNFQTKHGMRKSAVHDENNNDILTADLICAVCHRQYRNPKLLPCLHTFCERCLTTFSGCFRNRIYVKCPLCKSIKKVTALNELTSDFVALNLLDTCALNFNELNDAHCSKCSAWAQSWCSECAAFLCVDCQRAHKSDRRTKKHNVCALALLGVKSDQGFHAGDFCRTHAGQKLTNFCKTCDIVVCDDCTILDHPKDSHLVTGLSEVSPDQRRGLAELLSGILLLIMKQKLRVDVFHKGIFKQNHIF